MYPYEIHFARDKTKLLAIHIIIYDSVTLSTFNFKKYVLLSK